MNRRNFLRTITTTVVVAIYAPTMLLQGCFDASDISGLMGTLGGACASLAGVLGNSDLAATITKLTGIAVSAIGSWKSGTPTAMAIEAINDLEAAISQISGINPTVALLITLALGTADAILLLLPASVVAAHQLAPALNARPRTKINNPPKKSSTYKDYWNDLIAVSPDATLEGAIIK